MGNLDSKQPNTARPILGHSQIVSATGLDLDHRLRVKIVSAVLSSIAICGLAIAKVYQDNRMLETTIIEPSKNPDNAAPICSTGPDTIRKIHRWCPDKFQAAIDAVRKSCSTFCSKSATGTAERKCVMDNNERLKLAERELEECKKIRYR